MKPSELPELKKLADALNRHRVLSVLIGGMAVMLHGADDLTSDGDPAFVRSQTNPGRGKKLGTGPIRASCNGKIDL